MLAWFQLCGAAFVGLPPHHALRFRRVLFEDTAGGIFLYCAEHEELMQLPDFAGSLQAAVWDSADPKVVAAVSEAGAGTWCAMA